MKKSTSLFLIMILSGTDAVSGLVSHSVFTLRPTCEIFGNVECWILFAQKRSSMLMTVINIERYIGVIHPLFHHTSLKTRTLFRFLIFVWIVCGINLRLSFLITMLTFFDDLELLSVQMLFTLLAYTCIAKKVIISKRLRRIDGKLMLFLCRLKMIHLPRQIVVNAREVWEKQECAF